MRLQLIKSKNIFCLHGNQNQRTDKVSLKDFVLFCGKLKPNHCIQLAHVEALKQGTARYPIRKVKVKSFSIPMGDKSISKKISFWVDYLLVLLLVVWIIIPIMARLPNHLLISSIITQILFPSIVTEFICPVNFYNRILKAIILFAVTCVCFGKRGSTIAILENTSRETSTRTSALCV